MIDVLTELAKILKESRTGKEVEKLVEDLKASIEAERARERAQQNKRQADCRARKREQRSANLPVTVTVGSVLLPVTVTPPPPSPHVTVTSERNGSDLNFLLSETTSCKKKDFPDLSSRFSSHVTASSGIPDAYVTGDTSNSCLSSIPCQNTLFPLVELNKEERKKERTKERKKEERDRVLVVVRKEESKNLYAPARAREATAGQDKALEFGGGVEGRHVPLAKASMEAGPVPGGSQRTSAGVAAGPPKTSSKHRTQIADDWQLSEAGLEFAKREGLSPAAARLEAFRFADHARASGRLCAGVRGWEAAWRNWIRSPYRVRQAPAEQPFDVRRHIV